MRGYIIKLYPTEEQKEILNSHINLFRYTYNWALLEANKFYDANKTYIGKEELMKRFSRFRNENEWLQKIPLHSARLAISHLDYAFKEFFLKKHGFPRFKSKKYSKKCVHYRNEPYAFNFDNHSVRLSGFKKNERIECKSHKLPKIDEVQFYNCTVTFDGIDYWLSVNFEKEKPEETYNLTDESIGIDVGIVKFATLSNGKVYQPPSILKTLIKRSRKQQSRLSKMRNRRVELSRKAKTKLEDIPFTKNEEKLKLANIKLNNRIKNTRKSFLHQTSSEIVNQLPKRIVMEDLDIQEFRNRSKTLNNKDDIYHSMWYKFREYITYKAEERGIETVFADKQFPSSQICSRCGAIKKSSYRIHICDVCGFRIDRDLNAAINLSKYA
mgnify:FL=1